MAEFNTSLSCNVFPLSAILYTWFLVYAYAILFHEK